MLSVVMLKAIMRNVANDSLILSVVMPSAILLHVVVMSVVSPLQ
jgi:hypothetical protein